MFPRGTNDSEETLAVKPEVPNAVLLSPRGQSWLLYFENFSNFYLTPFFPRPQGLSTIETTSGSRRLALTHQGSGDDL